MKKIITILLAALFIGCFFIIQELQAQAPSKMSYQALVRNASNAFVTNQQIGMQISILQGSADGSAVYVETQTPTTNAGGLISIEIGNGTVVSGNFSGIDWSADSYFIMTEIDIAGGTDYTMTGTSQLLSVPYALYAEKAANTFSGSYNDLTDVPAGNSFDGAFSSLTDVPTGLDDGDDDTQLSESEVDAFVANNGYISAEVDGSTTNEIQDLQLSGHNLSITNNGSATTIDLSGYMDDTNTQLNESQVDAYVANNGYLTAEVDGSATNEIQDLQLSGHNLTITNNGSATTIDLSGYMDDTNTQLNESQVDAYVANNGYLTAEVDGSTTNEIQDLQLSGHNLTITNNGSATTIDLSGYMDDTNTQLNESQVDAFVANNGYLTAEVDGSVTNELELPSQSGQSGKFLTTNGTSVSWDNPSSFARPVRTISANTTLTSSDEIVFINGAFTATFPASPVDGQKLTLCATNSSAGINGNGKSIYVALASFSSLTFADASSNMYTFFYSSTLDAWMGNY